MLFFLKNVDKSFSFKMTVYILLIINFNISIPYSKKVQFFKFFKIIQLK